MIPYGRQHISDDDIQAVVDVLKSDFLTQGPVVPAFEKAVCDYTGAQYAVAVNSGTSALHVACLALGLSKGDWLWTTSISFVASANCGLYCGAYVDFVDINNDTWNISLERLKEKLEKAKSNNCLPKVLVAVHLCGRSCNMEAIYKLSNEYGFRIIEDACHAIGGKYQGELIGNCRYSDITVFSFHPVKTITTGEGGMAVTNNKELTNSMNLLRSHGITRDPQIMQAKTEGPWYYQQVELGFNYRMTDIQAALGISQLKQIDNFVSRRNEIAISYDKLLADLPVQLPFRSEDCCSAFHLYVIRLQLDKITMTHLEVFQELRRSGVGVNLHYIPIHTQPWYQKIGFKNGDFPRAEEYYKEAISLPVFPDLCDELVCEVVNNLRRILMN